MSHWSSEVIINPYVREAVEDLIIPGVNLDSYGSGLTEADIASICEDLNTTTCYLLDLVAGKQDAETAFEAVEELTHDHNMAIDDYLDTTISNLETFLECPQTYLKNQAENSPIVFQY